jgi:hypothetical protein
VNFQFGVNPCFNAEGNLHQDSALHERLRLLGARPLEAWADLSYSPSPPRDSLYLRTVVDGLDISGSSSYRPEDKGVGKKDKLHWAMKPSKEERRTITPAESSRSANMIEDIQGYGECLNPNTITGVHTAEAATLSSHNKPSPTLKLPTQLPLQNPSAPILAPSPFSDYANRHSPYCDAIRSHTDSILRPRPAQHPPTRSATEWNEHQRRSPDSNSSSPLRNTMDSSRSPPGQRAELKRTSALFLPLSSKQESYSSQASISILPIAFTIQHIAGVGLLPAPSFARTVPVSSSSSLPLSNPQVSHPSFPKTSPKPTAVPQGSQQPTAPLTASPIQHVFGNPSLRTKRGSSSLRVTEKAEQQDRGSSTSPQVKSPPAVAPPIKRSKEQEIYRNSVQSSCHLSTWTMKSKSENYQLVRHRTRGLR